jgi:hypothetical protein
VLIIILTSGKRDWLCSFNSVTWKIDIYEIVSVQWPAYFIVLHVFFFLLCTVICLDILLEMKCCKCSNVTIGHPLLNHFTCFTSRLGNDSNGGRTSSSLFTCAICQVDLEPSDGISVHAGSIFSSSSKPWEGPFLCSDCQDKKDAMEGKRPSGIKVL